MCHLAHLAGRKVQAILFNTGEELKSAAYYLQQKCMQWLILSLCCSILPSFGDLSIQLDSEMKEIAALLGSLLSFCRGT